MCEYLIPLDLVFPIAGLRVVGKALCFIRTDCGRVFYVETRSMAGELAACLGNEELNSTR